MTIPISGGGGEIPVGGAVMLVDNRNDFTTADGQRFLRSGFVETDTAGIDASVITEGAYFEAVYPQSILQIGPYIVKSDGSAYYIRFNTNDLYKSIGEGQPYSLINSNAGISATKMMAIGNDGTIVVVGNNSSQGYISYSTDDGLTFTTPVAPTIGASQNLDQVKYSPDTDSYIAVLSGTSGASGSIIYTSDDGISWVSAAVSLVSNENVTLTIPEVGGNMWMISSSGGSTGGDSAIVSTDKGANWTQIAVDAQNISANNNIKTSFLLNGFAYLICNQAATIRIYKIDPTNSDLDTNIVDTASYSNINSDLLFNALDNSNDDRTQIVERVSDGVVYIGSGFYSRNGFTWFPNGFDSNAFTTSTSQTTPSSNRQAIFKIIQAGTDAIISKSIPVAGSAVPYSEGLASQFVRIS